MRKYLLPESGQFYKANLHVHSTISDGRWLPAEIKRAYMERGYSIVAFTDHNVMLPHHDLTDENFLALTGVEIDIDEDVTNWSRTRAWHFCAIALERDNEIQPCFHRTDYQLQNAALNKQYVKFDPTLPDYVRDYTLECMNDMLKTFRDKGFFVTYNHPKWSLENYDLYMNLHNMHAMEICNSGGLNSGYDEHNSKEYDDMLRGGKRIYCIAADDAHMRGTVDAFGGFTVIRAEKLEYRTVTKALEDGHFYASEGPLIHSLWVEDGQVHVTFEPLREATITKATRNLARVKAKDGSLITEAVFDISPDDGYFRITVEDTAGKRAYTNAYFLDEIL